MTRHWPNGCGPRSLTLPTETYCCGAYRCGVKRCRRYTQCHGGKAKSVEEYLDALDPARRAELERIRSLVTQPVPNSAAIWRMVRFVRQ